MWRVLDGESEIAVAQQELVNSITSLVESGLAEGPIDCEVGWRADRHAKRRHPIDAYWVKKEGYWFAPLSPDSLYLQGVQRVRRYENAFGIAKPSRGSLVKRFVLVSIPESGIERRIQGAFAKDENGRVHLVHRGRFAGSKRLLEQFKGRKAQIDDGHMTCVVLVADLGSNELTSQIGDFVRETYHLKEPSN
jgi:hypothetical protein